MGIGGGSVLVPWRPAFWIAAEVVKEVASPKPPKPVPPCPHPGFLAPKGASWMAGDGFTRLDLPIDGPHGAPRGTLRTPGGPSIGHWLWGLPGLSGAPISPQGGP